MPDARLPDVHRALYDALVAMRDEHAPELHVYDLWRPDMALPAMWLWIGEGAEPETPDVCTIKQPIRWVVTIGVDPAATITDDARRLLDYVQLAWDALDPVVTSSRLAGAQNFAKWAAGLQLVQDTLGDVLVTCAELPLTTPIRRTVTPAL